MVGGMIIILCTIFGLSYGGYRLYKKINLTEANQKLILQSQTEKAQELIDAQQIALDQAILLEPFLCMTPRKTTACLSAESRIRGRETNYDEQSEELVL